MRRRIVRLRPWHRGSHEPTTTCSKATGLAPAQEQAHLSRQHARHPTGNAAPLEESGDFTTTQLNYPQREEPSPGCEPHIPQTQRSYRCAPDPPRKTGPTFGFWVRLDRAQIAQRLMPALPVVVGDPGSHPPWYMGEMAETRYQAHSSLRERKKCSMRSFCSGV